MNVTQRLVMDLTQQGLKPCAYAVQGDSGSRSLALELRSGGLAWEIPVDAALLIRYRKPDGTGGTYDTLPDGTKAWSVQGNVLLVTLAPQVCTVAGVVEMELILLMEPDQLTTFPLELRVAGLLPEGQHSQSYTNLAAWLSSHGANGISVTGADINSSGHLMIQLSDGKILDAGRTVGKTGEAPVLSVGRVDTLSPESPATVTMTGTPEAPVLNFGLPRGADGGGSGGAGEAGQDGVGIASVIQTTTSNADGGINVISVTKTDGTVSTFQVKNGSRGSAGPKGSPGASPVRGTDYWTAADIAAIKSYVDEAILGGAW